MRRTTRWMDQHPWRVVGLAAVATAVMVFPFLTMAPTESASTEPEGAVFDARDLVEERFASDVIPYFFIIQDPEGDLLRAQPLRELLAAQQALRDDPTVGPALFRYFDPVTETEIDGIATIADLVDRALPDGLAAATDAEVKAVGSALIDALGEDAPSIGLSPQASRGSDGLWVVPAISTPVISDSEVLGFSAAAVTLGGDTQAEEYARQIQELLRTADSLEVYGVAIDVNLTSQEQGQLAGPFIGFTILAVLLIVGLTFRSYWVLAVVGASLGALMIWLKGISNLIGLKDDLVLSLIVPIAMISFGVDFAFHAVGRYREERAEGREPRGAFVVGVTAVSGALVLALTSDAAAFLSNTVSGIESIIQFGVGAAIALAAAFLLLGLVTPLVVAVIEAQVPAPNPGTRGTIIGMLASAGAATLYMASVLLMVFVLPWVGVATFVFTVIVTVVVPFLVRRRQTGEPAAALPVDDRLARPVGAAITFLAARRHVVVPVALLVSLIAAFFAVNVKAEFDVEDFFSPDSDFVVALNLLDDHVGDRGGEPAVIYVEGPLDDPDQLARLDARLNEIRALETNLFARNNEGVMVIGGVFSVLDAVLGSPVASQFVTAVSGVEITDTDGNGIPDTAEQLRAVFDVTSDFGVPFDSERLVMTPDDVRTQLTHDERGYATQFAIGLVGSRTQEGVVEARDALASFTAAISADFGGAFVQTTGGPFVRQESLDATIRALQISLPVAAILCLLIAALFLRSIRFGIASVVPILMTVSWLYAFIERAGYNINIVTATIAAVSIGIGIDFAIHYISRYREELLRVGERLEAVRRAGEGTGSALVASAASSAVGFGILAFAPMPLFAAYGLLTAVMIGMALVATLVVLPGILVFVTRDAAPPNSNELEPAAGVTV
jgi:uncharacterized protein